ncbi:hypothetical protein Pan216_57770 [Planctomycetes bacterium Pan216]|uniref:FG-GAP repeat protein n=1 Tax=Kolteria novifilia TaxID=2527975 RepID=A0A518BD20_9BACT|nr:hypothetical protein Pan216_57770 [Planctomycetes bacterium Pan216]
MADTPGSQTEGRITSIAYDLVMVGLLLLTAIPWTQSGFAARDIALWDEANYLRDGAQIGFWGFRSPEYAPFYQSWYSFLHSFTPDTLDLYQLNYTLITALLTTSVFALLRMFGVGRLLAFLVSFVMIFSNVFVAWPWVGHFALAMLIGFAILAMLVRSLTARFVILATGLFIANYIRPEYGLCFLIVASLGGLCLLVQLFRDRRDVLAATPWVGLLAFTIPMLVLSLGNPFEDRTNRKFLAFSQHFSYSWVKRTGSTKNPWLNHPEIMAEHFGSADSVLGCLWANPGAFSAHIVDNLSKLAPQTMLLLHPDMDLPYRAIGYLIGSLVVGLTLFGAGRLFYTSARGRLPATPMLIGLGLAVVILIPTSAASLILFPRVHYLFPGLLLVGSLVLAAAFSGRPNRVPAPVQIALAVLLVGAGWCLEPRRNPHWDPRRCHTFAELHPDAYRQPVRKAIAYLRSFDFVTSRKSGIVFDAEGGLAIFAGRHFYWIDPIENEDGFKQLLEDRGTNMVVLSPALKNLPELADDEHFHRFLADPVAFGFGIVSLPGVDWSIAVEKSLLWTTPRGRHFTYGVERDIPLAGDWNGDGRHEIGVFRQGLFSLDTDGDGAYDAECDRVVAFGIPSDKPVTGDWDGDGIDDVGVYREGSFVLDLNGNGRFDAESELSLRFGEPGDDPVIGDWDGDGKDDVGVFRNGVFFLRQVGAPNGYVEVYYGVASDRPIAGDWNGDGRDDIGVLRGSSAIVDTNGDGRYDPRVDTTVAAGVPGSTLVAGDWSGAGHDQLGLFLDGWFSLLEDNRIVGIMPEVKKQGVPTDLIEIATRKERPVR